jgi:hypothetical protein
MPGGASLSVELSSDLTVRVGQGNGFLDLPDQRDPGQDEGVVASFLSAVPVAAPFLGNHEGMLFVSAGARVSDSVTVTAGRFSVGQAGVEVADDIQAWRRAAPEDMPKSDGMTAMVAWRFAPWGSAGATATLLSEDRGLFGAYETGALAMTGRSGTTAAGVSLRAELSPHWDASVSWNSGISQVTPLSGGLMDEVSDIRTQAYGFMLRGRDMLTDADAFGFSISRPIHVVSGRASIAASTGVSADREIIYGSESLELASPNPQTDLEVSYALTLGDMTSLKFNTLAQADLDGIDGRNALAGIATLQTRW